MKTGRTPRKKEPHCICIYLDATELLNCKTLSPELKLSDFSLANLSLMCKHRNVKGAGWNGDMCDWRYALTFQMIDSSDHRIRLEPISDSLLKYVFANAVIKKFKDIRDDQSLKIIQRQEGYAELINFLGLRYTHGFPLSGMTDRCSHSGKCVVRHGEFPSLPLHLAVDILRDVLKHFSIEYATVHDRRLAIQRLSNTFIPEQPGKTPSTGMYDGE